MQAVSDCLVTKEHVASPTSGEGLSRYREEGYARCTLDIGQEGEVVRLTITHEIDKPDSKLIGAVSIGWPKILSSLKTLLETGAALPPIGELPCS